MRRRPSGTRRRPPTANWWRRAADETGRDKEVPSMAATTTRPEISQIGRSPNGRVAAQRAALTPPQHSRLYWAISDTIVIAKRNLMHIPRIPMMLLDVTIQPIIFVVLF